MTHPNCPHCQRLEQRIDQHEKYIAQLVEILAKTNKKLMDLEQKHLTLSRFPVSRPLNRS